MARVTPAANTRRKGPKCMSNLVSKSVALLRASLFHPPTTWGRPHHRIQRLGVGSRRDRQQGPWLPKVRAGGECFSHLSSMTARAFHNVFHGRDRRQMLCTVKPNASFRCIGQETRLFTPLNFRCDRAAFFSAAHAFHSVAGGERSNPCRAFGTRSLSPIARLASTIAAALWITRRY